MMGRTQATVALSVVGLVGVWSALPASVARAVVPLPASDYGVRSACAPPSAGHVGCLALELVPRTAAARARTRPLAITTSRAITEAKAAQGAYGLRPQDLRNAYLPGEQPDAPVSEPQTIALVDAYNDLSAEADLKVYDEEFNLPSCTTANGCFQQVNQDGEAGDLPFPSSEQSQEATEKACTAGDEADCKELERAAEWSGEISLDIETAHAVCQNCKIVLVETNSEEDADMEVAEDTAARAQREGGIGADEISDSWAGEEPSNNGEAFNHPGIVIAAAGGDSGYLNWELSKQRAEREGRSPGIVNYPASSPFVVAVGGSGLNVGGPDGEWTGETAWIRGGSGCSVRFAAPQWQRELPDWMSVGCENWRAVSDVSADADPYTGVAVYDSFPESYKVAGENKRIVTIRGWYTGAGTSLASPIVASMFALAGGSHGVEYPAKTLYSHLGSALLHDITEGSDGKCQGDYSSGCAGSMIPLSLTDCGEGLLICNAASGYDGPSGVGTPNGIAAFQPARKHTWTGGAQAPVTEACGGSFGAVGGQLRVCGTLNPNASSKSGYYFAYNKGPGCTGGKETPLQPEVEGEGVAVAGELFGLEPDTEYAYCLVATDPSAETAGPIVTFTTKPAPPRAPEIGLVSDVTSDSAMLEGRLEHEAHTTNWYFEYAPGPSCTGTGAATTPEQEAAPRSEPVQDVHTEITGLQPSTIYALCLIARNAGGSTPGPELMIKTLPAGEVKGESRTEETASTTPRISPVGPSLNPVLPATPIATPPVEASKPAAKPLTRIEKLAATLKLCRRYKRKRERAACDRRARRRYGVSRARRRDGRGS